MDQPLIDIAEPGGDVIPLASPAAGPKPTRSLRARRVPLAEPARQRAQLDALELPGGGDFDADLTAAGYTALHPTGVDIFQMNVGKLCNMTCRHCHVDAGPDRTEENMTWETMEACLDLLDRTGARVVDITGGAPELNPHFKRLVQACVDRGLHVIDRCNLTVLLLPRNRGLAEWMAERGVEVVCSLPHWRRRNTDAQRGDGTYEKSVDALRLLNAAGYGQGDPKRVLTLMSNPAGAFLPSSQASMEREWKAGLARTHGVTFDRLLCLTNMPISRYLEWLEASGNLQAYMEKLTASFNPAAVDGLMCRNTLSIGWDGQLYDCDFNQMLDLTARTPDGQAPTVFDVDTDALQARSIVTARHCYGCTAGQGSSCGGATT